MIPDLKGKFDGFSLRVPTPTVSVVDFTADRPPPDERRGGQRRLPGGRGRPAQGHPRGLRTSRSSRPTSGATRAPRSSTPHRPWSSAATWSRSSPGTTTSGATAAGSPTSSRSSPLEPPDGPAARDRTARPGAWTPMDKLTVRDADVAGKRVFVRVDFNVPLEDGKVTDDSASAPRSRRSTTSLSRCEGHPRQPPRPAERQGHGRPAAPAGRPAPDRAARRNVPVTGDALGIGTEDAVKRMRPGEILLLENLRFHAEEEANDPEFAATARELRRRLRQRRLRDGPPGARLDGRRRQAPAGLRRPAHGARARDALQLLEAPERPFAAILGGAKVSDKIKVIDNLLTKVDLLVLGGGMANTFLLAQGKTVGKSLAEPDRVEDARRILAPPRRRGPGHPAGRRRRRQGGHPRHRVQDAPGREDPGSVAHRRPGQGDAGPDASRRSPTRRRCSGTGRWACSRSRPSPRHERGRAVAGRPRRRRRDGRGRWR